MGDFNNTPDSPVLKPLFDRLSDTAASFPVADQVTFPSDHPQIKIDYILYRGLTCTNAAVMQHVVSDHFPITADSDM